MDDKVNKGQNKVHTHILANMALAPLHAMIPPDTVLPIAPYEYLLLSHLYLVLLNKYSENSLILLCMVIGAWENFKEITVG